MRYGRISKDRTCPECKSEEVYRVRSASLAVRMVCKVASLRPRWCSNCDTFFLAPKHSRPIGMADPHGLANQKPSSSKQPHTGELPH